MKFFTLIFILILLFNIQLYSQSDNSDPCVNISIGAGMNYGGIGTKTVIGSDNFGLLIGLGIFPGGLLGYEFGFQYKERLAFVNVGYGVSGIIQYGESEIEKVHSIGVIAGGMFFLGKNKKTFLDIGIGHTFATEEHYLYGYQTTQNGLIAVLGIGRKIN